MWEIPAPTSAEMEARFTRANITDGIFDNGPLYCAFSKEQSAGCTDQNVSNYDANGIIYQCDQYWNKTATIPSEASVLLLNGKLDPQTPHKFAEYLLEVLDTSKKELITFDYATHDITASTPLWDSNDTLATCGMKLLASYVSNNGNLELLDRSCVAQMPAFSLMVPTETLHSFFGTDEAYDGIYNSSLSSK